MTSIIIDILNPDNEKLIEDKKTINQDKKDACKQIKIENSKHLRLQVININGEIIEIY